MKIILFRHGKPALNEDSEQYSGFIDNHKLKCWLQDYDTATVNHNFPPHKSSVAMARTCTTFVSSQLLRSIDSCHLLRVEVSFTNAIFREAGFPIPQHSMLSLPLNVWLVCLRVMWFFGYSSKAESFKEAKIRSNIAAKKLQDIALEKGSVGLIGHGIMNRLLVKQLTAMGWRKSYSMQEQKYFGYSVLEKAQNQ